MTTIIEFIKFVWHRAMHIEPRDEAQEQEDMAW